MTLDALVVEGDNRAAAGAVPDRSAEGGASVPTVTVTRRDTGLRVHVAGLEARTAEERQAAVSRILGALHAFDRSAGTVDVVVDDARA